MSTSPLFRRLRFPCSIAAATFASLLGPATHAAAAPAPSRSGQLAPPLLLTNPVPPSPTPYAAYALPSFAPETFLAPQGLVAAEFPWAAKIPDFCFQLLTGATRRESAVLLHAQKVALKKPARLHDMIELTALTDPTQAKRHRTELHRALAAAR